MKRPYHHIPNTYYISAFFREPELWDNRLFFKEPWGHWVKVSPTETNPMQISAGYCTECVWAYHILVKHPCMRAEKLSHPTEEIHSVYSSRVTTQVKKHKKCEVRRKWQISALWFVSQLKYSNSFPSVLSLVFCQYYETCCNSHNSNKT